MSYSPSLACLLKTTCILYRKECYVLVCPTENPTAMPQSPLFQKAVLWRVVIRLDLTAERRVEIEPRLHLLWFIAGTYLGE